MATRLRKSHQLFSPYIFLGQPSLPPHARQSSPKPGHGLGICGIESISDSARIRIKCHLPKEIREGTLHGIGFHEDLRQGSLELGQPIPGIVELRGTRRVRWWRGQAGAREGPGEVRRHLGIGSFKGFGHSSQ